MWLRVFALDIIAAGYHSQHW